MILVDHQIRDAVRGGQLGIDKFDEKFIQPASYDLRIGPLVYSPSAPHPDIPIDLTKTGRAYRIPPYGTVLLLTYESLKIPGNMIGRFGLQSRYARRGLIASTGPQVDPGYHGKLSVSLLNLTPASHVIAYKESFLSIEFHTLDQIPEKTYEGPYQNMESIGPEILEDLVRLEGVNLAQMQSQFSELSRHIEDWSKLAGRFDEFLAAMTRQTNAFDDLGRKLTEAVTSTATSQPSETRKIDLKQAMDEILRLFRNRGRLFYSDIIEGLNLDSSTVIEACKALERKGLIEGDSNGKTTTKRTRKKRL